MPKEFVALWTAMMVDKVTDTLLAAAVELTSKPEGAEARSEPRSEPHSGCRLAASSASAALDASGSVASEA